MDAKLKILMLEDLEEDAGLVERELRKAGIDFSSLRVDTREEFIAALHTFEPDVILSDHAMPQFNSIEALKLCNEKGFKGPFVLVTGTVSEEFAVECLKQGVDDYVLKSNLSRLPNALHGAIRQHAAYKQKREAEEALKKHNEQLIKINQELDSFVYSVSHNLRGPLASVLGLINLMRLEKGMGDPFAYVDLMEHRVKILDYTIKQILDYSRNARISVTREPVKVRELVDGILWQLEYMDNYRKTDVRISIDQDLEIMVDRYRFSIIVHNLITNAFRYIDETKEQPWVDISAWLKGDQITLTVMDNGVGIEKEAMDNIYDMFFRGTNKSDGAGLGLYITKESINKLGGTISIESVWKAGTEVTVKLPVTATK